MKRVLITILLLSHAVTALALTPKGAAHIHQLENRHIPDLKMPALQYWDLPNGWHVIFIEDHSLPLISAKVVVRSSDLFVPKGKEGVAGLLMSTMRTGGTVATPPQQLDEDLDMMALRLSDGISEEAASISLGTLSRYADPAFRHFFEILLTPRFDNSRFDGAKKRRLDGIRRQNENPGAIAQREFSIWLNGDTPWGRIPTSKSISHIGVSDLKSYYQDHVQHGEKWLVVTGDLTRAKLNDLAQKALSMDQPPYKIETLPALARDNTPGVRVVNKKVTQTAIIMGHSGTSRDNPDKFALLILNGVLGGNPFTNRLVQSIRVERGLAYSAWSTISFGPKQAPGLVMAVAMTRAEKTGEVVGLMKDIIASTRDGAGITEEAITIAKRNIMSATLFQFAQPLDAATQQATFAIFGYPRNYIQEFRQNIMKVTVADVKRVAKTYLHPDQLRILVVGDPKTVSPQLKPFGKVQVVQPSH
ncbi:MAG: hypothetical protein COV45_02615 [Deltaproteobacteria bacterium CG11_big_fil_rev_8_21_14_0_20_47_16]|nr:MAG: hypothetical protein COV45_02615 [Deltaproteobacteria bacterium CG11_big_fil_rev_8_21_14_0_20_47_16]